MKEIHKKIDLLGVKFNKFTLRFMNEETQEKFPKPMLKPLLETVD